MQALFQAVQAGQCPRSLKSDFLSLSLDEGEIIRVLGAPASRDAVAVRAVRDKAKGLGGPSMQDAAILSAVSDPDLLGEIFQTARAVRDQIHAVRLVLFAPLYVSNLCANDCRETFALGVSQISAGSRTNSGGYFEGEAHPAESSQFQLGDHRSLDEVGRDIALKGYMPSFCTGCYRLGRTGQDFMDLAKPGAIKLHCDPNALPTFTEYLEDYASPETRAAGEDLVESTLAKMDERQREISQRLIRKAKEGKRNVFV